MGFTLSSNSDDFDSKVCMSSIAISNCLEYDFGSNFSSSTLMCTKCTSDYYLNNGECERRLITSERCLTYHDTMDECTICDDIYYLSSDGTSCEEFPKGIFGCAVYTAFDVCSQCTSDYYLDDNQCLLLDAEKAVDDCVAYDSGQECSVCDDGFYLSDAACVEVLATDCLTISDENNCASC